MPVNQTKAQYQTKQLSEKKCIWQAKGKHGIHSKQSTCFSAINQPKHSLSTFHFVLLQLCKLLCKKTAQSCCKLNQIKHLLWLLGEKMLLDFPSALPEFISRRWIFVCLLSCFLLLLFLPINVSTGIGHGSLLSQKNTLSTLQSRGLSDGLEIRSLGIFLTIYLLFGFSLSCFLRCAWFC